MSIIAPFLAFLLVGALAAYHRLRLAYWAAITITALVACWLLGANPAATVVAAVLVALIAIPLLIPGLRKPLAVSYTHLDVYKRQVLCFDPPHAGLAERGHQVIQTAL